MPSPEMSYFFSVYRFSGCAANSAKSKFAFLCAPFVTHDFVMQSARTAKQLIQRGFLSIAAFRCELLARILKRLTRQQRTSNPLFRLPRVATSRCRVRVDSTPLCAIAVACQASFFEHHILWLDVSRAVS